MIRRFFSRLLLLVLIAACGYNWVQMQRLEAQVAVLQSQQHTFQSQQRAFRQAPLTHQTHTSAARLSLPVLTARWKHLQNQVNDFRSASKKVFHEII